MITDEDRSKLGELAMDAIDTILEQYGEEAILEDAILVFEVSAPDPEHPGERHTQINAVTTTHRSTVAGGIAQGYANTQLADWERAD